MGLRLAVLTICILCVAQKQYTVESVINEMFKGMGTMLPMAAVLLFGFTMGSLVKSLDTGNYLTAVFMGVLTPALLPMLSFLLCMLLSFATGTSMGTMAIMSVICLPMAINMGVNIELVAGAIFGGSIFGDHCSPISDTTIMSCATSGCDIIDHVKTPDPLRCDMRGCVDRTVYGARIRDVRLKKIKTLHIIASAGISPRKLFLLYGHLPEVLDLPRL